ncbi:unnamed protein product [Trichogramma brassicae]|uniref:Transglutaminase N-terminal domain-containing protein n=1 Tax=Trichogramma brassicae TaxID=86971 RepID=A0A6H5IHF9_9HYME|nr:unnamed protein product [Trichogramma brassicae]
MYYTFICCRRCRENLRHAVLTIVNVDYCLDENGEAHHTGRYDLMTRDDGEARLVVRRGQPFVLEVSLSRSYDPAVDAVSLVFTLEGVKRPQYGHGTLVASPLLLPGEVSDGAWQTVISAYADNSIKIKVTPAADAIIGKWRIEIDTKRRESEGAVSFTVDSSFYLIFNPWARGDTVYLANEAERQEYVLADTGLIWRGTSNRMRPSVWKYSQFERDILDCALFMMTEVGRVRVGSRRSSRRFSLSLRRQSEEERAAMLKALRQSESHFSRYYLNEEFNDVRFDFELRDDIVIGQPFSIVLAIRNQSRTRPYQISVILRVEAVSYTGRLGEPVKKSETERLVKPAASDAVRLDVAWEEYGPKLMDQSAFQISCLATIKDTNFEYFAQDDFRVRKPDIKIQLDGEPMVGELLEATARFRNPLPIPLKRGKFIVEAPGLKEQLKLKLIENVEVGGDAVCRFSLTPDRPGRATIAAKFYSKDLDDVDGYTSFVVRHRPYVSSG